MYIPNTGVPNSIEQILLNLKPQHDDSERLQYPSLTTGQFIKTKAKQRNTEAK